MAALSNAADDTIRVLFIEDDPAVAEMYKLKLELDGYVVTIASLRDNIGEALALAKPELIFLDTQRDQDAGMTTLRTLRDAGSTAAVPIIILSAHPGQLAAAGFSVMDYVVQADTALSSLTRDLEQWSISGGKGLTA
jgi:DNA-binding response OmpR family regulator